MLAGILPGGVIHKRSFPRSLDHSLSCLSWIVAIFHWLLIRVQRVLKGLPRAFLHSSNTPPYFHCVEQPSFPLWSGSITPLSKVTFFTCWPAVLRIPKWPGGSLSAHFNTAVIAPVAESTSLSGTKTSGSTDTKVTEMGGKQNVH